LTEDSVKIYFDDTGPGFDEKNLDRIFDPFFSTKKRGTGLGLAQVYRVITKFGGSVRAMNTEEGARVEISLKKIGEA
jgi:signal transduction histidine kinase